MENWSTSLNVDDEFEKLVLRMNPPRVTGDNASDRKATLIKVVLFVMLYSHFLGVFLILMLSLFIAYFRLTVLIKEAAC